MLGNVLDHLLGILVEKRVVLYDQEAVVVLLQYGHELETGKSPANIHFCDIAVQLTEDTRIVTAYEEDFVPLKVEVGGDGIYQQLWRGNQDVECVWEQGDGWVQFYFHDWIWAVLRI